MSLQIVATSVRDFANDARRVAPAISRKTNTVIRRATEVLAADIRAAAPGHKVPRGVKVRVAKGVGEVRATEQPLSGLMQFGSQGSGGAYIRHPVFPEKGSDPATWNWATQPTHPFFYGHLEAREDEIEEMLGEGLDEVLALIAM